jgi:hypothetical protein
MKTPFQAVTEILLLCAIFTVLSLALIVMGDYNFIDYNFISLLKFSTPSRPHCWTPRRWRPPATADGRIDG